VSQFVNLQTARMLDLHYADTARPADEVIE
jgi:hypothetical protein